MRSAIYLILAFLLLGWATKNWSSEIKRMTSGGSIGPDVFLAMAKVESALNPRAIGDSGRAMGLFQIHDAAVIDSGFVLESREELLYERTNTLVAIYYLYGRYKKTKNKWCAVSAFNRGLGNLTSYSIRKSCRDHEYVMKVKKAMGGL